MDVSVWIERARLLHGCGDLNQAVACYLNALDINPGSVTAHLGMGNALLAVRRHAEAVQSFLTALQVNPDRGSNASDRSYYLRARGEL